MENIENGFLAVFDILGYKSLIENNPITETATLVSGFIEKTPVLTEKFISSKYKDTPLNEVYDYIGNMLKSFIISDTIIICLPLERSLDEYDNFSIIVVLNYFFYYLSQLLRLSCDNGLPMRGGVDYGEFYSTNRSIVGKPFLNAFNLSESLEFVGCALTDKVIEQLEKVAPINQKNGPFSSLIFKYFAPLHNEINKRLYLLNWLYHNKDTGIKKPKDIRQYLTHSFHAHSKDVPRSVFPKIENTEIMLRYSVTKDWQNKIS